MNDIVERLRDGVYGLNRIPLCEEAAATIVTLRAELEAARGALRELVTLHEMRARYMLPSIADLDSGELPVIRWRYRERIGPALVAARAVLTQAPNVPPEAP